MLPKILILCSIIYVAQLLDFSIKMGETKLITWTDTEGLQQQLMLTQLNIDQKNSLVQKTFIPFSYIIDQNCQLIESSKTSVLFEPNRQKIISLQYILMVDNKIIDKKFIDLSQQIPFSTLGDKKAIIEVSQQPDTNVRQNLLYLFDRQRLMQIDERIYSQFPMCYMLSLMTEQLCQVQNCYTLSPEQLFDMEMGTLIKDFQLIQNNNNYNIILKQQNKQINTADFILSLLNTGQFPNLKEQKVNISGNTIIKVKFQLSQTQTQSSLRIDTQRQFEVNILLLNQQPIYALKTIKLFTGNKLILSQTVLFKPYLQINYQTVWKNDDTQIPSVEVYNENLQLEGRYSVNNYIDFQYNQQTMAINSNEDIIQPDYLQQVTTVETYSQVGFPLIVVLAAGICLLIVLFLFYCFRKRIFRKLCRSNEESETKEKKVKKQGQNVIETAKQLNKQTNLCMMLQSKETAQSQIPSTTTGKSAINQPHMNQIKLQSLLNGKLYQNKTELVPEMKNNINDETRYSSQKKQQKMTRMQEKSIKHGSVWFGQKSQTVERLTMSLQAEIMHKQKLHQQTV